MNSNKPHDWTLISFASSSVPLVLLILLISFPVLRGHSIFSNYSLFFFPFGLHQPLSNMTKTFIISTSVIFWSSYILLFRRPLLILVKSRENLSTFFSSLALGSLYFVLPLLVTLWVLAFDSESIPAGPWEIKDGNHGPWRYTYDLRGFLKYIFLIPVISVYLSFISWVIKPAWYSTGVIIASMTIFITLILSHYWLID